MSKVISFSTKNKLNVSTQVRGNSRFGHNCCEGSLPDSLKYLQSGDVARLPESFQMPFSFRTNQLSDTANNKLIFFLQLLKIALRRSVVDLDFEDGSSPGPIVNRFTCFKWICTCSNREVLNVAKKDGRQDIGLLQVWHLWKKSFFFLYFEPGWKLAFFQEIESFIQNVLSGGQTCTILRQHPGSQRISSTLNRLFKRALASGIPDHWKITAQQETERQQQWNKPNELTLTNKHTFSLIQSPHHPNGGK